MLTNQNPKPWLIGCGLGGIVVACLCVVSAWVLSWGGNETLARVAPAPAPLAQPPAPVPQPSAAISTQNPGRLEPLYQFTVTDTVSALAWSPDSRLLAIGTQRQPFALDLPSSYASLYLWDVIQGNGRKLYSDIKLGSSDSDVAFSPDARILAYRTSYSIKLWDVLQSREQETLTSADYLDAQAKFFTVATGREIPAVPGIPRVSPTMLSPDGKLVANSFQGPNGFTLKLYDAATGKEFRAIAGLPEIAFSHNSKIIVSRDLDYTQREDVVPIILSDVESGQVLHRLEGNVFFRSVISFSPVDRLIASVAPNPPLVTFFVHVYLGRGQIYLWDVGSGKRISLTTSSDFATDVAFSPDGRFLAAGSSDGTVQLWGIRP